MLNFVADLKLMMQVMIFDGVGGAYTTKNH